MDTVVSDFEKLERRKAIMKAFVDQRDCNVICDTRHPLYSGPYKGETNVRIEVFKFEDRGDYAYMTDGEKALQLPYMCILALHNTHYDEWFYFGDTVVDSFLTSAQEGQGYLS